MSRVERAEPQRARVHHRLHRAEAGDREALQRVARLAPARVVERGAVERQCAVADARERLDDPRQRERLASNTMRARRAAAFTLTSTTPGSAPSARSISQQQAVQRMPSTSTIASLLPSSSARTTWRDSSGRSKAAALVADSPGSGARRLCPVRNR